MRIENIILEIKAKQFSAMESLVKTPQRDFEGYKQQVGVWIGLSEALRIIEDARKKDEDE